MMQTEAPPQQSSCPSFSSYSSETFAQIAARVIQELQNDPHFNDNDVNDNDNDNAALFHDSEFTFVSRHHSNSSPDLFQNGHISPTYPLFGRDIRLNAAQTATIPRRLPLRALMFEERETTLSFSSSEDSSGSSNELEGVDEGTYCVWTPRAPCRKSTSVGSSSSSSSTSRRWKLRDLLLSRSHSDGKDPVLFVGPAKKDGDQAKRKLFLNPKFN